MSDDLRYQEAMTCLFKGEHQTAREKLRHCCEDTEAQIWKAFFLRAIAVSFHQEERLEEALLAFDEAVGIDPSPLSLFQKAEFLCCQFSNTSAATELFREALRKGQCFDEPTYSHSHFKTQVLKRMRELGLDKKNNH